jgi:hypothetical protein
MRYDGVLPPGIFLFVYSIMFVVAVFINVYIYVLRYKDEEAEFLNHSVKTYKRHNHFMSLLKHARKKIKGAEVEDVLPKRKKGIFKHSDGSEIPHHHSSHL